MLYINLSLNLHMGSCVQSHLTVKTGVTTNAGS